VKQHEVDHGERSAPTAADAERIKVLQQENRELPYASTRSGEVAAPGVEVMRRVRRAACADMAHDRYSSLRALASFAGIDLHAPHDSLATLGVPRDSDRLPLVLRLAPASPELGSADLVGPAAPHDAQPRCAEPS
jgi:hypothetical protein